MTDDASDRATPDGTDADNGEAVADATDGEAVADATDGEAVADATGGEAATDATGGDAAADAPMFRRVPEDRYDEYQQFIDYAFHPEDGPTEYAPDDPQGPDLPTRQGERLGVFVGDELCSVCTHYDFEARWRGEWAPLAGLAAVATPPEHRREGYVTEIVRASLDGWRGEYPLSALWPFEFDYYRQFGWAMSGTRIQYTCDPDDLAFARDAADDAGTFRQLTADDWHQLVDVHETHAEGRGLTVRRDETWWRERVFRSLGGERAYVYAHVRDADESDADQSDGDESDGSGTVDAYLAYTVDRPDSEESRRLTVRDLAYADADGFRQCLRFLADHDSQIGEVRFRLAREAGLFDQIRRPGTLDCEIIPGAMVRIVDVTHALAACPYPDDATATCSLAVRDGTVDWNDGCFELAVENGHGRCEPIDLDGPADATLDIGTLSQLVVGTHGVADARRVGDLSVTDESVADDLAALFPPETVSLRTFF